MTGEACQSGTAVNSAIAATEDTPYTFNVADFRFSDAVAADTLASVTITSLPSDGMLALNGPAIADGQVITAAELNAGDLTFVPNTGSTTAGSFQFQVTDSLGNSPSSNTATMDITITPPPAIAP
jgi:large repetitive protein